MKSIPKVHPVDHYLQCPNDIIELYYHLNVHIQSGVYDARWTIQFTNKIIPLMDEIELHRKRYLFGIDTKASDPVNPYLVMAQMNYPATRDILTQEKYNFLNFLDRGRTNKATKTKIVDNPEIDRAIDAIYDHAGDDGVLRDYLTLDADDLALALAFRKQVIEETIGLEYQVPCGEFIMEHTPLSRIDDCIEYNAMRLVFQPQGIFVSFDSGDVVSTPFWWSPTQHTFWILGYKYATLLDIFMACIWRDACVVKRKMYYERTRGEYKPNRNKDMARKLILPRTVSEIMWGNNEQERTGIIHKAHGVRGHYRRLNDEWSLSDDQIEEAGRRAEKWGFPPPPPNYTFITPHVRGNKGEEYHEQATQVICRGLQTSKLIFG